MKNVVLNITIISSIIITIIACDVDIQMQKSSAKAITAFSINGISGEINETEKTISVTVPNGTSVTAVTPVVTVSDKSDYSPKTAQDFTTQKTYTVTAEDESTQNYTVTVTIAPPVYTIIFNSKGGTDVIAQEVIEYMNVNRPANPTRIGYAFVDWYKDESCVNKWNFYTDKVTENITLYAQWESTTLITATTLLEKLQWLEKNAESNTDYMIEINNEIEYINPHILSYDGKNNIVLRLVGIGSEKTIELYGRGSLFTIENGVTLILDENIILKGISNNNNSLIRINSGGSLILNSGAKIIGNKASTYGGGVYVHLRGSFTMNGGEISGNTAGSSVGYGDTSTCGGGVYINFLADNFTMNGGIITSNTANKGGGVYGTVLMNGGEISGNNAISGGGVYGGLTINDGKISRNTASSYPAHSGESNLSSYGGGVYADVLTMNGGEISGNTVSASSPTYSSGGSAYGGGVYVNKTFTMINGKISNNTASSSSDMGSTFSRGGGVYVTGDFIMNGGNITYNSAISTSTVSYSGSGDRYSYGGGIYVNGNVTINDGIIFSNTSLASSPSYKTFSYGGGLYIDGNFTMEGGEFSRNTTSASMSVGGGIYFSGAMFKKNNGIIWGYLTDKINGNVAKSQSNAIQNNSGHAVYVNHSDSRFIRRKEISTGIGEDLFFTKNEPYPPTINGSWDE